jgi:hypothetical protein
MDGTEWFADKALTREDVATEVMIGASGTGCFVDGDLKLTIQR